MNTLSQTQQSKKSGALPLSALAISAFGIRDYRVYSVGLLSSLADDLNIPLH